MKTTRVENVIAQSRQMLRLCVQNETPIKSWCNKQPLEGTGLLNHGY